MKLEIPNNIRMKMKHPYDLGLIVAEIMKQYSHDPKTQTGAAIIDTEYNLYGVGSNTYPQNKIITDIDKELLNSNGFDNPHRYRLEHAERNAIAFGVRNENPLFGKIMTVSYTPCVPCANNIANVGLKTVVDSSVPDFTHKRWGADWKYVIEDLFKRTGIQYVHYIVDPKVQDRVQFELEKIVDKYLQHSH